MTQRIISYVQALREAAAQEMQRDPRVVVMGQGVDDFRGIYGSTKGLVEQFGPDRVFDTPLSEEGMTGVAIGMALAGLRPIHTHIRMDFMLLAMNQLINLAAKSRYMFGGQVSIPLVVRSVIGRSWGQGAQHSQGLHSLFMHIPGLRVVAPTTPYDAKGLLVASIRDDNPVIFVEHRMVHSQRGHVPTELYTVPFGKARVLAEGDDITLVGVSHAVIECLRARQCLQDAGIEADVIDPVSLCPLDMETIIASVRKTGVLLVVDSAWTCCGASAEILAQTVEALQHERTIRVGRMGFAPVVCPTAKNLEELFYPNAKTIASTAHDLVRGARGHWAPDEVCAPEVLQFTGTILMQQTESKPQLLAEQTISTGELNELADWLRTNPWLTQGTLVRRFESAWAQWLGTRHAVFVNSGSSANLLMYDALKNSGRLRNDRVIVPAVSWATTVAPAIQLGFEPILCDADPETWGLDLNHLEQLLKEHDPGSVILVHVLGCPNRMHDIIELKQKYGFLLMEDCCAAHGSTYAERKVGTFGELSTFSFYYGHHMSTIEGGMICGNQPDLWRILLHLRSHGWAKDLPPEEEMALARLYEVIDFNRLFTFYYPGYNVRSTDLNAKIGLMQMKRLDGMIAQRVANHRLYQSRVSEMDGFACQHNDEATISSISFACMARSLEHREHIARRLREHKIETRPLGGGNMSRQPFWMNRYPVIELPVADRIHTTCMQLPNNHLMTEEDVNSVCDELEGP